MNIANLWVTLGARTSGLLSSLGEAGRIIATFSANTRVQLAQIQAGFRAFNDVSRLALAAGAFTLLAGAIALSIKPAIEFETAFAHVLRTVEGTPAQLAQIRSGILALSTTMPESAKNIAEVAATAGQLGVATPYVLEFTKTMIMLGTATNLSAEQAAIGFSRLMTIMNIAPQEVGLLGAAITQLGNNSATTESEILTVALRLGAAAKIFGFTGEQTLALSAGLRSLGIQSQVAGSSMSRVLLDMSAAAQTGGPKLEAFARVAGMTGAAFGALVTSGDPQKAQQALLGFADGLTRIQQSGGNIVAVLKSLGFNTIQLRQTLLSIATSNGQLSRSFDLVSEKSAYASALIDEYSRQAGTTASILTVLKNKFTALAIDTGTPLLGGIKSGAEAAGRALLAMEPALRSVGQLTASTLSTLGRGIADIGGYFGQLAGASEAAHGALYVVQQSAQGALAVISRLPAPITAAALAMLVFWRNGALAAASAQAMSAAAAFSTVTIASFNANLVGNTVPRAVALTFGETARELAGVGLGALASIGPTVALTAGMYSLSRSMGDVAKAAGEIKNNELKGLTSELDAGNIDDYNQRLATLRANVASQEWTKFDTIGFYAQGLAKYLTLGNAPDNLLKAKGIYEGMAGALQEAEKNASATNINNLAKQWNVGADVIEAAATKIGATKALSELTPDTAGFKKAVADIQAEVKRMEAAAKAAGVSVDSFAQSGTGSVEQLAKNWKVSTEVIEDAAAKAKVNTDDLLDPKKAPEALAKIGAFVAEWQLMAKVIGVSTDKIHEQITAVDNLTGSMSELAKAMKGVKDSRDALTFQPKSVDEAAKKLDEARKAFASGKISITELGDAYGGLNEAFAASGADYETATKLQQKLGDEFLNTADKAKVSKSESARILSQSVNLTIQQLADLTTKGQDAAESVQGQMVQLAEQLHKPIVMRIAAETGQTEAQVDALLKKGDEATNKKFDLYFKVEDADARKQIADDLVAAGVWTKQDATLFLKADSDEALRKLTELRDHAKFFNTETYGPTLKAENEQADAAILQIEAKGSTLDTKTYGPTITANTKPFDDTMTLAEGRLAAFARSASNVAISGSINAPVGASATGQVTGRPPGGPGTNPFPSLAKVPGGGGFGAGSVTRTNGGIYSPDAKLDPSQIIDREGYSAFHTKLIQLQQWAKDAVHDIGDNFATLPAAVAQEFSDTNRLVVTVFSGIVDEVGRISSRTYDAAVGPFRNISTVLSGLLSGVHLGGIDVSAVFESLNPVIRLINDLIGGINKVTHANIPKIPVASGPINTGAATSIAQLGLQAGVAFADGGISAGPQAEQPGGAKIYQAAPGARLFAEPVTGGEAYIPMAQSNRPRSTAILGEVARSFGLALTKAPTQVAMVTHAGQITTGVRHYAEGGFDSWPWAGGLHPLVSGVGGGSGPAPSYTTNHHSLTVASPISIEVHSQPGMDEKQLAALVGERVEGALTRAAKDIRNRRMVWQAG